MRAFASMFGVICITCSVAAPTLLSQSSTGLEVAVPKHLADGEEFSIPLKELLAHCKKLLADPTADINNTIKVRRVMRAGRWIP